jgi:miniconductance mechanosensitive channel
MIEDIQNWLGQYPLLEDNIKFVGVILLSILIYFIVKKIIIRSVKTFIKRTKTKIDDLLLNEKLLKRISVIAPLIVFYQFIYLIPGSEGLIKLILDSLIVLLILLILGTFITALNDVYERSDKYRDYPIKGYLQIVKIILYILGTIIIAGILTRQEPWTLVTGLGALTAVIILIFKDTILSFVASIQISSYDLVKKDDWIEVPKYGADGDVIDIALHTVKVQNWDKTITVIPTYKLIEESFKNWRGMQMAGGRRVKRPIYIDVTSIKFCTEEILNRFEKFYLITDYIKNKRTEIKQHNESLKADLNELINGRRLTNLGTFRAYLKAYLKSREDVHNELTFLVRHLDPGPTGLPIEIYVFANKTEWAIYEDIQAEIFDHIFAAINQFDLKIFQYPTSYDVKSLPNYKNPH